MKKMIWICVFIFMAACSQDQATEVQTTLPTPQPVEKEVGVDAKPTVSTSDAIGDANMMQVEVDAKPTVGTSKTQIEVQVEKKVEVTQAVQPDVKLMPKKEVQHSKNMNVDTTKPMTKVEETEEVVVAPTQVKMVAPLVQGKGEVRSEPKVIPKSGMMLKEISGDAIAGKKVAKKCMSCHTFEQGGKKKTGPNLFGIMGQAKGSVEGYRYGEYLSSVGGVWDEESLRAWIADSKAVAKAANSKTKMAKQRITGKKADDLIAYLKTLK